MNPVNPGQRFTGSPVERSASAADAKLRQTATQLEGLFIQRMFAAMRETVPQDGLFGQSSGEQTFGSMLDEKLAEQAPTQWSGENSLSEALYRQLRKRIEPALQSSSTAPVDTSTNPADAGRPSVEPLDRSTGTPDSR
jgi:flagellar protein FlgJ